MEILLQGSLSVAGHCLPKLDGVILQFKDCVQVLSLLLDPALSWGSQIATMSK